MLFRSLRNVGPPALIASVMLFSLASASAAGLEVRVLDREGRPASGIVVFVERVGASQDARVAHVAAPAEPIVIDQADQQFVPQVVAVRTGSSIVFPNSDTVAHQVYSFSAPKRFALGLYRGDPHPPVLFDTAGLVVLGCNIHDKMVGYVYVTDAPYFGTTDEAGRWRVDEIEPAQYRIRLASPRLAKNEQAIERALAVAGEHEAPITFQLSERLRPLGAASSESRVRDY